MNGVRFIATNLSRRNSTELPDEAATCLKQFDVIGGDPLRKLFELTVARCMSEGLVGGESSAVDASLIRADANRQSGGPGGEGLRPEVSNRAVREYIAILDDAAFGAATPVVSKFLTPADPAPRWTCAHGGQAFYAYSPDYLIDLDQAVITDMEASTAVREAEIIACKRMIARVQNRFGIWPERLAADTGYGSTGILAWLVHEVGVRRDRARIGIGQR